MREIRISAVGKEVEEDCGEFDFTYKRKKYKKLIVWNEFDRFLNACKEANGFYLNEVVINKINHLVLCYSEDIPYNEVQNRKFIIASFFENADCDQNDDDNDEESDVSYLTVDDFYERLKQAHANEDFDGIPENVQHPKLKSSTVLRPYQMKSVKWMLKRELKTEDIPLNYIKMQSKANPGQIFYYNPLTHEFRSEKPEVNYPKGGINSDEMGLGKSVEMITLILMNPRKKGIKRSFEDSENSQKTLNALSPSKKSLIKCPCNKEKINKKIVQKLIVCSRCTKAQHISCVFQREITDEDRLNYLCLYCWKSSGENIDAKTTIIVSPTAIKKQWASEFSRHVCDKNFKVLVYDGITNGWISPSELAKFDCIITDFNTLSRELYFADIVDRKLRHDKKFEYPQSPLLRINWWRVILDEAQMVENKNARPSQMVKQLPAFHRWCTTGTPIEKGSIQHLYGLVYFLDIHPYTNAKIFDKLWFDYRNGRPDKLIQMISKVMWRTCKKDVEHEIKIPEQKEVVHFIEMSDLQKCFYQQVHIQTRPVFLQHIQDYLLRNSRDYQIIRDREFERREKIIDPSLMDKKLYELDNATIKTFLEPLRKIRQDVTIANLFVNVNDQTRVKQTLRADQLHDHLVSKASIECKSALRTICSSLNGMAAIKLSEKEYDEAIKMYRQVIRLSKDYTGVVSVDSMLQIHSYYNLTEAITVKTGSPNFPEKEEFQREMSKLEWKYVSNYYDKVKAINNDLNEHIKEVLNKASRDYTDNRGLWWRDIIAADKSADEEIRFFNRLNEEIFSSSVTGIVQSTEQIRSVYGLQLIITEWLDKVENSTREVLKKFKNLDYISKNLRPAIEQSNEINMKIDQLVQDALNCHLHLEFETDEEKEAREQEQQRSKKQQKLCEMCKLKRQLDEYECILFNKSIVDDNTEGTWNPRLEERLLKALLAYAKRQKIDDEIDEMGTNFFKYLNAIKTRYKLLAQLWVEVNYTIAAFDELNMSKMRMQVVETDDEISDEDRRYNLKIVRYEAENQFVVFQGQKQEAEVQFTRIEGRLKYLEHLKSKNDKQVQCPICVTVVTERYYVTVCGHSMCSNCFACFSKDRRSANFSFNCPVCRTSQKSSEIYAVTFTEASTSNDVKLNGRYSPKIDEIIRCIIKLKQDEADVKILIFSHWDSILSAIIYGLKENNITYRASFGSNFNKQIEEFKDYEHNVTCMMMNLKFGGKGLNLTEASHVFLVEPILNADEELQAIGRIHRIGQTKETFVHKFIAQDTIESAIYTKIIQEKERWIQKHFTIRDLENIFSIHGGNN